MWAALVVAVVALGVLAPASRAQAPSLSGELLEAQPAVVPTHETSFGAFTCDKAGTTTISFEARGFAAGPYSGTFTETGTVTIGPQTNTALDTRGVGAILDFQATFTITSEFPPGTVTGTKRLAPTAPTAPTLESIGRCDPDGSSADDVLVSVTNPHVLYDAQIDATTGARTDSGTASVLIDSTPFPATATFQQLFNSSEPPPPADCPEDDDQQGNGDDDCDDDDDSQ